MRTACRRIGRHPASTPRLWKKFRDQGCREMCSAGGWRCCRTVDRGGSSRCVSVGCAWRSAAGCGELPPGVREPAEPITRPGRPQMLSLRACGCWGRRRRRGSSRPLLAGVAGVRRVSPSAHGYLVTQRNSGGRYDLAAPRTAIPSRNADPGGGDDLAARPGRISHVGALRCAGHAGIRTAEREPLDPRYSRRDHSCHQAPATGTPLKR